MSIPSAITVTDPAGRTFEVAADPGLTLAQAVYLHADAPPPLCSGLGRCGLCRMVVAGAEGAPAPDPVDAERSVLSEEELAQGWRLGCRHMAVPGLAVRLPAASPAMPAASETIESGMIEFGTFAPDTGNGPPFRLAVDLGTTSIHWSLLDGQGTKTKGGSALNPQMGAGSEVMSRLAFGLAHGAGTLRGRVLDMLRDVLRHVPGSPDSVEELCVAGNPAMLHLLLDMKLSGLAAAPYALADRLGRAVQLADDLPPAYAPPLIAPFVGGDLSAGLAHALWSGEPVRYPFLLADMGTNGEFLLALSEDRVLAASCPLGPALEGIGLSCGRMAGAEGGAVASRFLLAPGGLQAALVNGASTQPRGITGAGYLSLLAVLLRAGVVLPDGRFADAPASPLGARLARSVTETDGGERRLVLPGGLYLSGADIEEIAKVKSTFNVAVVRLLEAASIRSTDLSAILLAGALGAHVAPADLSTLGFVPQGAERIVRPVGNGSLLGAELLLRSPELREPLARLAETVQLVELAGEEDFNRRFIAAMEFRHVA